MSKSFWKSIGVRAGVMNATLAMSLGMGGSVVLLDADQAFAAQKRALFASAAQCRKLSDDNVALCCGALNRGFIMGRDQLALCPPMTTSAFSTSSRSPRSEGGNSHGASTGHSASQSGAGKSSGAESSGGSQSAAAGGSTPSSGGSTPSGTTTSGNNTSTSNNNNNNNNN